MPYAKAASRSRSRNHSNNNHSNHSNSNHSNSNSNSNSNNSRDNKAKSLKTKPLRGQACPTLLRAFRRTPYPTRKVLGELSQQTGRSLNSLRVWYQNKRARAKKQMGKSLAEAELTAMLQGKIAASQLIKALKAVGKAKARRQGSVSGELAAQSELNPLPPPVTFVDASPRSAIHPLALRVQIQSSPATLETAAMLSAFATGPHPAPGPAAVASQNKPPTPRPLFAVAADSLASAASSSRVHVGGNVTLR